MTQRRTGRRGALTALAASSLLVASVTLATPAAASPADDAVATVTKTVTLNGLLKHADRLQAIADANGGNRASGLPGDDASATYVDSLTPEEDNAPPGVHDALAATGYQLYGNLSTYAFDVNADAVATAIVKFAYDTSPVNGVASTASARAASATAGAASTDAHGHARK